MAESKSAMARRELLRPFGLEAWGPFRDLDLSSRMNRMVEEVFGEHWPSGVGLSAPPIDITEEDDRYNVTAEIPGVKKEDLTLELESGVLTIAGEKRIERKEDKEKARWLERSYGAFSRSFTLPSDADPERVDASFKDGVLRVEIAKRPEAKPKAINVK